MVALTLAWQIGAHTDAWYHAHYGTAIDSFFTWTHALLYVSWAGTAAVVLSRLSWHEPLGRLRGGYLLVITGVAIFGTGGLIDFGWHALFGFEAGLATLFSPSHLWLLVGVLLANLGVLLVAVRSRPERGAWPRRVEASDLPVLLSYAALFRATLWTVFYAQPLAVDYASGGAAVHQLPAFAGVDWQGQAAQVAGTTGILLHTVVLALFLTAAVRVLHVPAGGMLVIMLWDGLLSAGTTGLWLYVPAAAAGALVGEVVLDRARRGHFATRLPEARYWVLAASVPVAQFAVYFGLMAAFGGGIRWTAHLWTGAIAAAGVFGLISSVLAVPPGSLAVDLDMRRAVDSRR
jgi:hypothetical protein